MNVASKRLLYVTVLRPIWNYHIPAWGYAAKSNMKMLLVQQNTILRKLVGAQWYISNETIHRDLRMETVDELARKLTSRFEARLHKHPNTLAL